MGKQVVGDGGEIAVGAELRSRGDASLTMERYGEGFDLVTQAGHRAMLGRQDIHGMPTERREPQ